MGKRRREWPGNAGASACEAIQAAGTAYARRVQWDALATLASAVAALETNDPEQTGFGVVAGPAEATTGKPTVTCPACKSKVQVEHWSDEEGSGRRVAPCWCGMAYLDGFWYVQMPMADE